MDERIMQFRVGVMVLATTIIAGILLVLFGEAPQFGWGRGTYPLEVRFPAAPGVTKDTPVRKSGILIGRVTDVRFAKNSTVLVTTAIYDDVTLYKGETCRIKGGLLGDAILEFVPGPAINENETYAAGDRIENGQIVSDPLETLASFRDDITEAIDVFSKTGQDVSSLARRIDGLLGDNEKQIEEIMNETQTALKTFNRTMENVNAVIGDQEAQAALRKSLQDLPQLVEKTKATFDSMQHTIQLADENLENLSKFTGPLGERGDRIVVKVADSVDKLDALLAELVTLSQTLNSDKGSLGQLLNNPDLYQSLTRAARNIEEASEHLEPIVSDARAFTDKVSRHPGVIVRDAIRPGPGIK